MSTKFRALMIIVLLGVAGIFFFFYRMGSNDTRVLADFPAAYDQYDQAVSDYSKAVLSPNQESQAAVGALEQKADEARAVLNTKAAARISSLTKHDGDLMNTMLEISSVSKNELDALKTYKGSQTDSGQLENKLNELKKQRQSDYARFIQLAGE